jgi:hypothetical protein
MGGLISKYFLGTKSPPVSGHPLMPLTHVLLSVLFRFSLVQTFTQVEDTMTINLVTAAMVKMSFIVNQSTILFYLQ